MSEQTTKVRKTESIFKTIGGSPKQSQAAPGPTPASAPKSDPQPAAPAPAVSGGQPAPGQTAPPAPQATSQATTETPQQEPSPAAGTQQTQGPKEIPIDDPEAIIVMPSGERVKAKDAAFHGFSRAKQLQEEQRIASARKEVQNLAESINAELSDPIIKDYRILRQNHPDWTPEQARDAALRANGSVLPNAPDPAPAVDELPPEPPAGAVPGDKDWNAWIAKISIGGAENAIKKYVAPLIADVETRKKNDERKQQLDRIASENVNFINNRTQEFTHVDLDGLLPEEKGVFYDRVGEVLARRGLAIDRTSNRWNTPTGTIDPNVYAFAVEAAWPEGTSPKKAQAAPVQTPAQVMSEHLNTGLGIVPDSQRTPTPASPSASIPTRTPMKNPREGRKSDNPLRDLMQRGTVQGA